MEIIPDEELLKIPIKDNGERLIKLEESNWLRIEIGTYIIDEGEKYVELAKKVRGKVAEKLKLAHSYLPEGFKFLLRCGFRPLDVQGKIYLRRFNELRKEHMDWSDKQLKEETSRFVAPIDIVPPHSTGGALDISVVDDKEKKLDMGTRFGEFSERAHIDFDGISEEAKKNRKMLANALLKAGFVNYPAEWWHWSYGDRYWAAVLKKKYSIYGGL